MIRRIAVFGLVVLVLACGRSPLEQARGRIESGDYAGAEKILESLLRRGRSSEALVLSGRIQLMHLDADGARASFRKAVKINPRSRPLAGRAMFDSARAIYLGQNVIANEDFALATMRESVSWDPLLAQDIAGFAMETARDAAKKPGSRDHVALLALAVELRPVARREVAAFLKESADDRLKRGDLRRAVAFASALARIDPARSGDAAGILRDAAMAADSASDEETARTAIEKAIAIDPRLGGELDVVLLRAKLKPPAESVQPSAQSGVAGTAALLESMKNLAALDSAIGRYAKDYGHYPDSRSIDQLIRLLVPAYVDHAEAVDGWKHPLRYLTDADSNGYRIMSAGGDGAFEESSGTLHSRAFPVLFDNPALDIIYENGVCVQCPSEKLIMASRGK